MKNLFKFTLPILLMASLNAKAEGNLCEPVSKLHKKYMSQSSWETGVFTKADSYQVGGAYDEKNGISYPAKVNMPLKEGQKVNVTVDFSKSNRLMPLRVFKTMCEFSNGTPRQIKNAVQRLGKASIRANFDQRAADEAIIVTQNFIEFDQGLNLSFAPNKTFTYIDIDIAEDSLFNQFVDTQITHRYYHDYLNQDILDQAEKNKTIGQVQLDLTAWPILICDILNDKAQINVRQEFVTNNEIVTLSEIFAPKEVKKYYSELIPNLKSVKSLIKRAFKAGRVVERLVQNNYFKGQSDDEIYRMYEALTTGQDYKLKKLTDEKLSCTIDGLQKLRHEPTFTNFAYSRLEKLELKEK